MTPTNSVAGLTRSQIENWDITHLETAAARWRASAAEFAELFAQHRQNVSGTDWHGAAKDAAVNRVTADSSVVGQHGETVRAAADLADASVADLRAAVQKVLTAIAEAEADGFRVAEDLKVTDARRYDITTIQARNRALAEYAENIQWNANQLVAADTLIGERLQAKASELDSIRFDGEGQGDDRTDREGTVWAVDYKLSPNPEPNPTYPGRDKSGRFMPGNTGSADGAAAAEQRLQGYETDNKTTVIRQQIRVAIIDPATGQPMTDPKTGNPLFRLYDGLEPTGRPGQYVGVEVKSGSAERTRQQRIFDNRVNEGRPATGMLNGQPVEVVRAIELRAQLYVPGEGAKPGEGATGRGAAGSAPVAPRIGGGPAELPVPRLVDGPARPGEPDLPVFGDQRSDSPWANP